MALTRQPDFGRRLRSLREARGLSQRDLARTLVTASYISLLESGRRLPTIEVVTHLATVLEVAIPDLLGVDRPAGPGDPGGAADRVDEQLLLADLALASGDLHDYATAAATLEASLREARAEADTARTVELGMRLQHILALLDRGPDRLRLLRELWEVAATSVSDELHVVLATDLASALRDCGELSGARGVAQEAAERVKRAGLSATDQHVRLLGVLVSVLVDQNETRRAEAAVLDLLEVAAGSALRGWAHRTAALAYAGLARPREALDQLEQAHRQLASPALPLREWMRFCRSSAAILLDVGADLAAVRPWLLSAETAASMLGLRVELARVLIVRAGYELAAGQAAECLRVVDRALVEEQGLSRPESIALRVVRARALGQAGDPVAGIEELRRLADECEELHFYRIAVQVWHYIDDRK